MTDAALPLQPDAASAEKSKTQSTLARVVQYTGLRMVALFFTILIGVYLTILLANMGGYVDQIRKTISVNKWRSLSDLMMSSRT